MKDAPTLNRLSFNTLEYFSEVYQTLHLAKVSQRTQLSKSVLSAACTQLSTWLQLPLLEHQGQYTYPNPQALDIAKYLLLIKNLEQTSQRLPHDVLSVGHISLKLPARLWSLGLYQWLLNVIDECATTIPQLLLWLDWLGQTQADNKFVQFEIGQPPIESYWTPLGTQWATTYLNITETAQLPTNATVIATELWYLYSSEQRTFKVMTLADLAQERLLIPRLAWPLLNVIIQYCNQHQLVFEHISEEPDTLLRQPPSSSGSLLVSGLLRLTHTHPAWHSTPVSVLPLMSLTFTSTQEHAALTTLQTTLIEQWSSTQQPKFWQAQTSLKQWRYFTEIIKQGSLSSAAQSLYLAQPTLSTQLKHLEQALGGVLLERRTGTRQFNLTPLGQQFYQLCLGLHYVLHLMLQYAQRQRLKHSQRLILGVLPSVDIQSRLLDLVVNRISEWLKQYPEVRLEIIEERQPYLIHALRNQTAHLAITEVETPWMEQWVLTEPEEMGLIVHSDLLPTTTQALDWSELANLPLILPRLGSGIRTLIDAHCLALGVKLVPALESDSLNINRIWLLKGRYALVLPRSALASVYDSNPQLRFVHLLPRLDRILRLTALRNRALSVVEERLIHYLTGVEENPSLPPLIKGGG